VIRLSTERPEAVETGFAQVVGVKKRDILALMEKTLRKKQALPKISPYGDGAAAKQIVEILMREEIQ